MATTATKEPIRHTDLLGLVEALGQLSREDLTALSQGLDHLVAVKKGQQLTGAISTVFRSTHPDKAARKVIAYAVNIIRAMAQDGDLDIVRELVTAALRERAA